MTITIDTSLFDGDISDLRNILRDALEEYVTRRTPAAQYVDDRYPGSDAFADPQAKRNKVQQVNRCVAMARTLHGSTIVAESEDACTVCGFTIPTECDGEKCR